MNKNLFRLVFNAARGQVMAVSEVAGSHRSGQGESTSVEGDGARDPGYSESNWPTAPIDIAPTAIKTVVATVALLAAPAWFSSAAWAQAAPATTVVVNAAATPSSMWSATASSSTTAPPTIQGRLRFAHSDWPGYSSFDEAFMPGPRAGAWGGMTGGSGVIW